jgi:hypothetical protein
MCTRWVFRGCSHSLIGIRVHSEASRACSVLTQWCSCALTSIQGMFNTDSKAFMHTHKHSGHVQYWLKGVHAHSQVFRECSVLTQMRSFSWSHHGESRSIITQWHSCALNWCSHSLNCIHANSKVFRGCSILTHWCSCTLNGCSGAVPTHSLGFMRTQWVFRGCSHSLIGIHLHSQVFRKCSIHVQPVHVPDGPMNMFSNLQTQGPYKLALNFHWMPFLRLCQARRHDVTLEYMIGRWSWCPPMRLATQNKKVLQNLEK